MIDLGQECLGEVVVAVVAPAEVARAFMAVEVHLGDPGLVEEPGQVPDELLLHGPIGEERLVGVVHELLGGLPFRMGHGLGPEGPPDAVRQ